MSAVITPTRGGRLAGAARAAERAVLRVRIRWSDWRLAVLCARRVPLAVISRRVGAHAALTARLAMLEAA